MCLSLLPQPLPMPMRSGTRTHSARPLRAHPTAASPSHIVPLVCRRRSLPSFLHGTAGGSLPSAERTSLPALFGSGDSHHRRRQWEHGPRQISPPTKTSQDVRGAAVRRGLQRMDRVPWMPQPCPCARPCPGSRHRRSTVRTDKREERVARSRR